jgi:hypothetical protein
LPASSWSSLSSSASALGSDRGQAGLLVVLIVVAATLGVERLSFERTNLNARR